MLGLRRRACIGAPDRVDAAAGGGDLRLQGQVAGNAPGAEVAHGGILGHDAGSHLVGDLHLAGVIGHTVLLRLGGRSHDSPALSLGDGHDGDIGVVPGQVHGDAAALVVDDDHAGSTLRGGGIGLRKEGGAAAGAHGDLALNEVLAKCHKGVTFLAHVVIVAHAGAIHQDEVQLAGDGGHGLVAVAGGLGVEYRLIAAVEVDRRAGHTNVVDGGDGQGVVIGSGAAAGGEVHVVLIQVDAVLADVVLAPVIVVAGGVAPHDVAVNQLGQCLSIDIVIGITGHAGAQGQVHRVAAQGDGVLDGDEVVGIVSAAALAEHLHDQQLSVGGFALGHDLLQGGNEAVVAVSDIGVARGDTGHVGTVLALGIVHVGDVQVAVHIVGAKGHLGVAVHTVHAAQTLGDVQLVPNSSHVLGRHQSDILVKLADGVLEGIALEQLVIGIQAGIDDGDLAAGAGIAGAPGPVAAHHLAGGGHVGLRRLSGFRLVTGLKDHVLDADHVLDGLDLAKLHVGGDHIGRQRHVPYDVQLGAAQNLFGDLVGKGILLGPQAITIPHGTRVVGDSLGTVAFIQGRCVVQHDGYTDDFVVSVIRGGFQFVAVSEPEVGNSTVVDFFKVHSSTSASGLGVSIGCHGERQRHGQDKQQRHEPFPCPTHTSFLLV